MNPWAWWTQIRERRHLQRLAKAGNSYAVRVWAVSSAMTAATQRVSGSDQAATIRAGLARQRSATATPHGIAHASSACERYECTGRV